MTAPSIAAGALSELGRTALICARAWAVRLGLRPDETKPRAIAVGLFTLGTGLSMGLLLLAGPTLVTDTVRAQTLTIEAQTPDLSSEIASLARIGAYTPKHYDVAPGDTLLSVFAHLGIHDSQALAYVDEVPQLKPFLALQPGQHIASGVGASGELEYLRLYLEGSRSTEAKTIELSRIGRELVSDVLPFTFATMETLVSGTAAEGLTATAKSLSIPDNVADQLLEVWDGADDPTRALAAGSTVRLIYEKKYADGRFVKNGQLLAAQIISPDKTVHEAFWFSDGEKAGSFYTLDGRSASQTFLRVPLDIKDVSSEFAPLRRHPVTGQLRPHNGTDLRAPQGSRILAAADGRVTRVAFERRGYGNYVQIDHGLGRTTLYAHMQRVQKGIRPGVLVKKGQLIGLVGRTGLATGPHLHYELMIDGVQINPATADLPDTENLSAYQLAQLRSLAQPLQSLFEDAAKKEGLPSPEKLLAESRARAETEEADAAKDPADRVRLRPVSMDIKASPVQLGGAK
ncbi:M23 family metallopeptidase [Sutterella sp.]|uniref:M23 family metallopeptidase n=1 Tax=Sutterella sp. TaxID=1981025 RepID=UPI0026DEB9BF|nr:M23 family metallopeptidase [Sutterella sp.]MDO5532555.1 M23 family metallopeptidase [Sutterella sp.]